jgi:hypothetical protein
MVAPMPLPANAATAPQGPAAPPKWSWKRALLHALFAFIAVLAVGVGAFALLARPESDGRVFGEGLGRLSVFSAAVVFVASWLLQTGSRKTGIAMIAGIATVMVGLFVLIASGAYGIKGPADNRVTAAERAPLEEITEAGERRLRHPAFGFSIRHPGPGFQESAEVVKAMGMRPDPESQTYGFIDADSGAIFALSVMKGMGASQLALKQHLDNFERGLRSSLAVKAEPRTLEKGILWDERRRVGTLRVAVGEDIGVALAAYAVERPAQAPFIVNLSITAHNAERFKSLLDSFRP